MIPSRINAFSGLACRLALGLTLAYAGYLKIMAPAEEFAYAIETYKVTGPALSLLAANLVPWIELFSGLLLAAGIFSRLFSMFCGAMIVFFELLLAQAFLRGLPITSCGCFGSAGSNSLGREFAQNLLLLGAAFISYKYGEELSSDRLIKE